MCGHRTTGPCADMLSTALCAQKAVHKRLNPRTGNLLGTPETECCVGWYRNKEPGNEKRAAAFA